MNMFENAKLVKADGKYAVQLDNQTVVLSDEKQAKLAANNVAEQDVVLGVRPEHIELTAGGIEGKVDVSEMMGSTVHLHVTSMGRDVVLVVSTMNMTGAEVAALSSGSTVHFSFPGHAATSSPRRPASIWKPDSEPKYKRVCLNRQTRFQLFPVPHLYYFLIKIKAAPHNSARSLRQDFCSNSKFRKWRNTVCISHFRNCGSGAKRRLRLADAIARCCP